MGLPRNETERQVIGRLRRQIGRARGLDETLIAAEGELSLDDLRNRFERQVQDVARHLTPDGYLPFFGKSTRSPHKLASELNVMNPFVMPAHVREAQRR